MIFRKGNTFLNFAFFVREKNSSYLLKKNLISSRNFSSKLVRRKERKKEENKDLESSRRKILFIKIFKKQVFFFIKNLSIYFFRPKLIICPFKTLLLNFKKIHLKPKLFFAQEKISIAWILTEKSQPSMNFQSSTKNWFLQRIKIIYSQSKIAQWNFLFRSTPSSNLWLEINFSKAFSR